MPRFYLFVYLFICSRLSGLTDTLGVERFRETQRLLRDNEACLAAAATAHALQRQLDEHALLCKEEHVPVLTTLHHERDALEVRRYEAIFLLVCKLVCLQTVFCVLCFVFCVSFLRATRRA